jgi:hypothetical protein
MNRLCSALVEHGDPGLCFQVIVEIAHQHADTPYAFTLSAHAPRAATSPPHYPAA